MSALLLRRLGGGVLTLLLLVVLAFLLMQAAPGGLGAFFDDPGIPLAARQAQRAAFGLDRPAPEQLVRYVGRILKGDLGLSLRFGRPVLELLGQALPPTLLLVGTGIVLAFALGLTLGTRAALRPGGITDRLVRSVLPALDALPPFWLGLLAIWLFAWKLGWLPASHLISPDGGGLVDRLRHLILPALVIAIPGSAPVARHHSRALRGELTASHVRCARLLGLPERQIWLRRAGRLALRPAVVLLGLALPVLAGGAAVVEVVFSWPGLGRLLQEALLARDFPLALGGLLLSGGLVIGGGIGADLLAGWIDPRVRRHHEETP